MNLRRISRTKFTKWRCFYQYDGMSLATLTGASGGVVLE